MLLSLAPKKLVLSLAPLFLVGRRRLGDSFFLALSARAKVGVLRFPSGVSQNVFFFWQFQQRVGF